MKSSSVSPRRPHQTCVWLLAALSACAPAAGAETPQIHSADPTTAMNAPAPSSSAPAADAATAVPQDPVAPPEPKVELPELPFDKSKLELVQQLDAMIVDAARLGAAVEHFDGVVQALEAGSDVSLNGTHQDRIRAIMAMVDAFRGFEAHGCRAAEAARQRFVSRHESDDAFTSGYRELYGRALDSLDAAIQDNVLRRKIAATMDVSYRQPPRANSAYLTQRIEHTGTLRTRAIERVVRTVDTSLMVADYKKGRELAELLTGAKSTLSLIRSLDPDNDQIGKALGRVAEKFEQRMEVVRQARAAYRLPERHSSAATPANAEELEASVRGRMQAKGYEVRAVRLASAWRAIRSPLGVHLYDEIDFYVAATSRLEDEAKEGVVDVLYVTGRTGRPSTALPFAAYSVGLLAQMDATNL